MSYEIRQPGCTAYTAVRGWRQAINAYREARRLGLQSVHIYQDGVDVTDSLLDRETEIDAREYGERGL